MSVALRALCLYGKRCEKRLYRSSQFDRDCEHRLDDFSILPPRDRVISPFRPITSRSPRQPGTWQPSIPALLAWGTIGISLSGSSLVHVSYTATGMIAEKGKKRKPQRLSPLLVAHRAPSSLGTDPIHTVPHHPSPVHDEMSNLPQPLLLPSPRPIHLLVHVFSPHPLPLGRPVPRSHLLSVSPLGSPGLFVQVFVHPGPSAQVIVGR
jgi:hypothetical protein